MSDDPQLIRRCIQEYPIDEDESLKLFEKLSKPDAFTCLEKLSRMHSGGAGSPHLAFQKFVEGDGAKFYQAYRAMPEPSLAEKRARYAKAAGAEPVTAVRKGAVHMGVEQAAAIIKRAHPELTEAMAFDRAYSALSFDAREQLKAEQRAAVI